LNLQTDQFNLHEVLKDELTNRSVRFLRDGENKLTDRSVRFMRDSKKWTYKWTYR